MIASTGSWLKGRQVLISPHALQHVSLEEKQITISLTQNQLENSPSLETDKPVSRQMEEKYSRYYGWPMYWNEPIIGGYYPNIFTENEKPYEPNGKNHSLSHR